MMPGINNSGTGNKSADTRMANTKTAAKQQGLVGNSAAQQSLRKQTSQVKVAPVGKLQLPEQKNSPPVSNVELPTSGPVMPPEAAQGFDPDVFKEDMEQNMIEQIRTTQLANSPRVKDATTSVQIKEFFNQNNPNRKQDSRSLMERVINRMGMS